MAQDFDASGIWRSKYWYTSSSRGQRLSAEHEVQLFKTGNDLIVQSLPSESGSYLFLRLTLDSPFLTGLWHEYTSPGGHYKGAAYYGVIQLKLSEDGNTMRGKWLGFGKQGQVNSDEWELVRANHKD